jgi:hypothetical protein
MDLVDISSPTGKEIGVAQYLVARMRKSGMQTGICRWLKRAAPTPVGRLRGFMATRLNLLFTGHMGRTSYSGREEHPGRRGALRQRPCASRDGWVWGLGSSNI